MPPSVVTANRLSDGSVVFLDAHKQWVQSLQKAAVFTDGNEAAALQQARLDEARQIVVDPYPVDVVEREGRTVPKTLREVIRATGPTVRPDFTTPQPE